MLTRLILALLAVLLTALPVSAQILIQPGGAISTNSCATANAVLRQTSTAGDTTNCASVVDDGSGSLKRPGATSDAAPSVTNLIGAHAWPGATVNTTGADIRLAPGIGRRIITIDDYTQAGVGTVTVTVNGTATVLTAGTDFTAATSNNVTATNLAAAIDAIAGVTATASSAVVRVTPDDTTYTLTLARSVAAFATVTSGADGNLTLASGQLLKPNGAVGTPSDSWTNANTTGWWLGSNITFSYIGAQHFSISADGLRMSSAKQYVFASGTSPDTESAVAGLRSPGAGFVAATNGSTGYGGLQVAGNAGWASAQNGITFHRTPDLIAVAAIHAVGDQIRIAGNGTTDIWEIGTTGILAVGGDNTYDIGASGATRPRTGYFGTMLVAPKFTTTGTGTYSGYTLASGESIGVTGAANLTFGTGNDKAFITVSDGNSTNNTTGWTAPFGVTHSFLPASGSGSFAAVHVNPTINGTSSGTAYGLVVASKTNTLTGGTIKLLSLGTTTTDAFTGYTEVFSVNTAGTGAFGGGITIGAAGVIPYEIVSEGRTRVGLGTNGNVLLRDNAGADFGLLQFGGTTNAFPALKRNSVGLDVKTADDAGLTWMQASAFAASTYLSAGSGVATSGAVRLVNTGAVSARNAAASADHALLSLSAQDIGIHSGGTVTLANTADTGLGTAPAGLLTIVIGTDNDICTFYLRGAGNAAVLGEDGQSGVVCTTTKGGAGTVNVYYDATGYFIQNNRGAERIIRLVLSGV